MLDRIVEVFCEVDDFCKAFLPQWEASLLEAVRKLKPFKINALAANELAREKPGNGFHARRQRG